MTSARILFPQFHDEQSASRYPFADTATLIASTGLRIENDTFIDASFFGIGGGARLYLSAIIVTEKTVTFTIGDNSNAALFTGSYAILNPPENNSITFTDTYGRPAGVLLAGTLTTTGTPSTPSTLVRFSSWNVGTHNFTVAATEFAATTVIPAREPGVRALVSETSAIQTGDVWLVGNNGIVLRSQGAGVIRVDIVGEPLFKRVACEECCPENKLTGQPFLRTINGCGHDEAGNFVFTATAKSADHPALRVYPNNGALTFKTIGP